MRGKRQRPAKVQVFTKVWAILDQTRANVQVNLAVWQIFRIWREMKCIFARPLRFTGFLSKDMYFCMSLRASPGARCERGKRRSALYEEDTPYVIVEIGWSKAIRALSYITKAKVEESPAICPLSAHKIKYG